MHFSTIFFNIFLFFGVFSLFSSMKHIDYIRSLEMQALEVIKEAYDINETEWHHFLQKITDVRNKTHELFSTPNPLVKHDSNISAEKLEMIYAIFKEYAVNPQSIHIIIDNNHILEKTDTLAQASITLMTRPTYHGIENPTILISEKLLKLENNEIFKALIYHELGHLLEIHGPIQILVRNLIKEKSKSKNQEIAKNNLHRVHEFIADQYCASQKNTVLSIVEKYLQPKNNNTCTFHPSKLWYPNIKERFASFLIMKNTVYGNEIKELVL